jgi:hypothetical protein
MKLCHGTEEHCVKWSKPGSERQRSPVFSHTWKTDSNTSIIIYTHIYTEHLSKKVELLEETKDEKNDREWIKLEYITPV